MQHQVVNIRGLDCAVSSSKHQRVNPGTYKGGGGRGEVVATPSSEVLLIVFLDDKTSAPDVFSSCSFIPRAHFETSLVMVSSIVTS